MSRERGERQGLGSESGACQCWRVGGSSEGWTQRVWVVDCRLRVVSYGLWVLNCCGYKVR